MNRAVVFTNLSEILLAQEQVKRSLQFTQAERLEIRLTLELAEWYWLEKAGLLPESKASKLTAKAPLWRQAVEQMQAISFC